MSEKDKENGNKIVKILFRVSNDKKEEIEKYADKYGFTTVSSFIRYTINKEMQGVPTTQQKQEIDDKLLNRILEKLELLNGRSKDLELQNELLTKMVNVQQSVMKKIPEKTIEQKKSIVLDAIKFFRTQLNYKINKTPISTKKIVDKTKLKIKPEEVLAILGNLERDNIVIKHKNGWDLKNDE